MTELTINQALQQGIAAHKAGQLQEADRFYTAILRVQPKHPDANHNMGVLAVGVGKVEQALPFFKNALDADPATTQFWLSYIDALIILERLADAKAVLDQAKSKGAKGDGFGKLEKRLQKAHKEPFDASRVGSKSQPQQPNTLDSLKLDQALRLAKKKVEAGSTEEANHIYRDILAKFPQNKRARDGIKRLENVTIGTISKVQDPPQSQQQSIINLYSQGQLEEALKQVTELLQNFPNSSILFNTFGIIHLGLGHLDAAIAAYSKALTIKPDYAEANNNMGIVLKKQGKLEKAVEAYNKALAIKPKFSEAYNNLGNALQEQGKPIAAIEAYNNALAIKPDYPNTYRNIGLCLKGLIFNKPYPALQKTINRLLDKRNCVRPSDVAGTAISLLKFEPNLQKYLQAPYVRGCEQTLQQAILDISEIPLLLKLMSICPLPDFALESLLTDVRAGILFALPYLEGTLSIIEFQSALALQCFSNEYLYEQSKNEENAIKVLEASVEALLSKGEQPSPQAVLCLASYKALYKLKLCDRLTDNNNIHQVFTRQITEPKIENNLKSNIPVLERITEDVSLKVREQYEDSPYPRWVNLGLSPNGISIPEMVVQSKIKIFDPKVFDTCSPNILIAGCGTGQHPIGTAARFKNSKLLAIDLSRSSLAYAKRKTEGIDHLNIEYMQADILNLEQLNRQFDIIESIGVLHHMNDPMAGWKVLRNCLKVGGLMNIGLYSEIARKHIVEMRKEISQSGIGSNDAAMKSFRSYVMASDEEHHKLIYDSIDFYSMSTLRDLLFHVQEHRFTIPQIKHCLSDLGLKFCGFEEYRLVQNFRLKYAGADDPYNLDKWEEYEEANPHTFAGMYQFWCQKLA